MLHPNKSADVLINGTKIGVVGEIHPACKAKYDTDSCVLAELNMSAVKGMKKAKIRFTPVAKYPAVSLDLAMIVEDGVTGNDITSVIRKAAGNLLKDVTIFDVYKGANIPEGYKSVAVAVVYQSPDKTLADADIQPVHKKVIDQLREKLHAQLRDS